MKHCERFSSDMACAISLSTWSLTFNTTVGLKSRPVTTESVGGRRRGKGRRTCEFLLYSFDDCESSGVDLIHCFLCNHNIVSIGS